MSSNKSIRLDPSRLYGFKIVTRPASQTEQAMVISAKIGEKPGFKGTPALSSLVGAKIGQTKGTPALSSLLGAKIGQTKGAAALSVRLGAKIGGKVGVKN